MSPKPNQPANVDQPVRGWCTQCSRRHLLLIDQRPSFLVWHCPVTGRQSLQRIKSRPAAPDEQLTLAFDAA